MDEEAAAQDSGGVDNLYRRRLDRSPEKQEFFELPENDRRLIYDLRSAMQTVYEKFSKLRDQVNDREAEDIPGTAPDRKITDLVDMYGDPAVNEELRQRLSRLSRLDPKAVLRDVSAHDSGDDFSREKEKRQRSMELEDFEISVEKEKRKRQSLRRKGRRVQSSQSATESDDEIAARKPTLPRTRMSSSAHENATQFGRYPVQGNPGFFPPFYPWPFTPVAPPSGQESSLPPPPGIAAGYLAPPYPYSVGVMTPVPFVYPPVNNGPTSGAQPERDVPVRDTATAVRQTEQQMAAEPRSSLGADAGHDLLTSFAQRQIIGSSKPCDACGVTKVNGDMPALSSVPGDRCPICAEPYIHTTNPENSELAHKYSTAHMANANAYEYSTTPMVSSIGQQKVAIRRTVQHFGRNFPGAESFETKSLYSRGSTRFVSYNGIMDKPLRGSISQKLDKQIAVLLEELEKSKDLNIQLRDELLVADEELHSLRFICQNKDAQIRSQATGKLAVMVQEIYRAQKERDVAMMNRIKRANAERDEAFLRLKKLQQKFSESNIRKGSNNEEKKLNEILSSLKNDNNSVSIEHRGTEIVEAINRMKEQRWQIAAEEMRAILEERDMAAAKCKDLSAELSEMQLKLRRQDESQEQRQVLQGKLFAMEHERNAAVEKISKLEDEMLSLRIYYNLHGSLSQEVSLFQQYSQTLDRVEKQLREKEEELESLRKDRETLLQQLKISTEEKKQLSEEVEKSQEAHDLEHSKSEKLQRLVNVLRRKINGLGIKFDEPEQSSVHDTTADRY